VRTAAARVGPRPPDRRGAAGRRHCPGPEIRSSRGLSAGRADRSRDTRCPGGPDRQGRRDLALRPRIASAGLGGRARAAGHSATGDHLRPRRRCVDPELTSLIRRQSGVDRGAGEPAPRPPPDRDCRARGGPPPRPRRGTPRGRRGGFVSGSGPASSGAVSEGSRLQPRHRTRRDRRRPGRRCRPSRAHVRCRPSPAGGLVGLGQVGLRICALLRDLRVPVIAVEQNPDAKNVPRAKDQRLPVVIEAGPASDCCGGCRSAGPGRWRP
jgi:hypothetical protein